MNFYILTHNTFKFLELSRYFENIGISPLMLSDISELPSNQDYICISEQTKLFSKSTLLPCLLDKFETAIHFSELVLMSQINQHHQSKSYSSKIEGFIFPQFKTNRTDVYNWDDIFFPINVMKSYQDMKDLNIKNSARDINFSQLMFDLPHIFQFEHINLKFNPIDDIQTISFEPVIQNLFLNNPYYQIAYNNDLFKPIINFVISDGIFIRSATNRKQKNYWLPGLNAGIPLTPKKDELHELTFMFHDIMHFVFPDLIVTNNQKSDKHKYIISRMISEAFTLVLADILFISLLEEANISYNYSQRKIFPLFQNIKFDVSKHNIHKIKELLWANTAFALLGDEDTLKSLIKNDSAFESYKSKYQPIFQSDYIWTNHNFSHLAKNCTTTKQWFDMTKSISPNLFSSSEEYCPQFNIDSSFHEQVLTIFNSMFSKLESIILNSTENDVLTSNLNNFNNLSLQRAIQRYMSGQLFVFYKFDTIYNHLFLSQLIASIQSNVEISEIKSIYDTYIELLKKDNFITQYDADNYKNIFPFFDPFFVFYDRDKNESFSQTLNNIFMDV